METVYADSAGGAVMHCAASPGKSPISLKGLGAGVSQAALSAPAGPATQRGDPYRGDPRAAARDLFPARHADVAGGPLDPVLLDARQHPVGGPDRRGEPRPSWTGVVAAASARWRRPRRSRGRQLKRRALPRQALRQNLRPRRVGFGSERRSRFALHHIRTSRAMISRVGRRKRAKPEPPATTADGLL